MKKLLKTVTVVLSFVGVVALVKYFAVGPSADAVCGKAFAEAFAKNPQNYVAASDGDKFPVYNAEQVLQNSDLPAVTKACESAVLAKMK